MIRGLKLALIVWGVIHILLGLAFVIAPYQAAGLMGFGEIADFGVYIAALCGALFIATSVGVIVAGRDPLRHIMWVKFVILLSILGLVFQLYLVFRGAVDFSQAGGGIIIDTVFAVVFLALYPYRAARSSQ